MGRPAPSNPKSSPKLDPSSESSPNNITIMSSTPFHPQRLLQLINQSLSGDDPVVNTASDAIAIFVHSCLLSVGFRLLGLHENDRLGSSYRLQLYARS